jgi:rfaE bifunctional protein nucleotidyltransferase chain/domain
LSTEPFYDVEALAAALRDARRRMQKVVLANGCFDLIHVGHVRYLREAAAEGDILVVAVNDDDSARLLKGEGRPIFPAAERAEILLALAFVDHVLIFSEPNVEAVMKTLRPDVHAKGTDYTVDTVPELEVAREIGCRTVIVGDPKDRSSRDIIRRLRGEDECGS